MVNLSLIVTLVTASRLSLAAPSTPERRAAWPFAPHKTSGRNIVTSEGKTITYAGTNWSGHADVMIPDGLEYQSIETIVSRVKSLGMNAVRLTYAIQMIDDIYANNGEDVTIEKAFKQALGTTNGTKVLAKVLQKNPTFTAQTTRLEVFDAVAAELARQQVFILLDNHISKGKWCCSADDGNTWWGDREFNVANWNRGLAYMAEHGKAWPALVAMSLRNEPREPPANSSAKSTYNWRDWYGFVKQGANSINRVNKETLIFLSGLNYDTYVTPVVQGTALTPGTQRFSKADFVGYGDKLVLEIHNYEGKTTSCSSLQSNLYRNGFEALSSSAVNQFPILLTEYGFLMDDDTYKGVYSSCLASYLPAQKAGFFIWVLTGSYYIRSGTQDFDETWGLFNHDWSNWRNPNYINEQLIPMIEATLA